MLGSVLVLDAILLLSQPHYVVVGDVTPSTPEMSRQMQILEMMKDASGSGSKPLAAQLAELIRREEFLPKNGVVHIVGPGDNSIEWLWPLVVRPDVKVVVSEPDRETNAWQRDPKRLLRLLKFHAPLWLEMNPEIQTEADIERALTRFSLQEDAAQSLAPKADLVIIRNPRPYGLPRYEAQLKPGSVVWMTTFDRAFTPPIGALYIEGNLAALPMQNLRAGPNNFEEAGFIWVAGSDAKTVHSLYDHGRMLGIPSSSIDPFARQCRAWMALINKLEQAKKARP